MRIVRCMVCALCAITAFLGILESLYQPQITKRSKILYLIFYCISFIFWLIGFLLFAFVE